MRVHLRDGAQDMRIKDSRLWLRILIAIAFLVGTVAVIFELLIWQSNKLSPEFRTAARPAFEAIQQCERYVDQSAFAYGARLENAENNLAMVRPRAKTPGDRRTRYVLEAYLHTVTRCKQDWETHRGSDDLRNNCQEMLSDRAELDKWLK